MVLVVTELGAPSSVSTMILPWPWELFQSSFLSPFQNAKSSTKEGKDAVFDEVFQMFILKLSKDVPLSRQVVPGFVCHNVTDYRTGSGLPALLQCCRPIQSLSVLYTSQCSGI